jgi:hypothetical protein
MNVKYQSLVCGIIRSIRWVGVFKSWFRKQSLYTEGGQDGNALVLKTSERKL